MEINIHNQADELPFFACTCISAMIKVFWLNNCCQIIDKHKLCLYQLTLSVNYLSDFHQNYDKKENLKKENVE